MQAFGVELGRRVGAAPHLATGQHLHMALLNQSGTDAPGAKALGVENFLQLHGP